MTRTPLRRVSKRHASALREYKKLRDEYMADHLWCEAVGCDERPTELHHKRGREKYLCVVKWFAALCSFHHRMCKENPTAAKKLGLLVDRIGIVEE